MKTLCAVVLALSASWHPVIEITGQGNKQTDVFEITGGKWRIAWDTTKSNKKGTFAIAVYDESGKLLMTAANVSTPDKDETYIHRSGKFYLSILATVPYAVRIEEFY